MPGEFINNMHILSFDRNILNSAYDYDPDLNYVLNLEIPSVNLSENLGIDMDILYGCCLSYHKLSQDFVSFYHLHNKKVMTYSCNSHTVVDYAISLNVDVIMTDDPGSIHGYFLRAVQKRILTMRLLFIMDI